MRDGEGRGELGFVEPSLNIRARQLAGDDPVADSAPRREVVEDEEFRRASFSAEASGFLLGSGGMKPDMLSLKLKTASTEFNSRRQSSYFQDTKN